MDGDGTNIRALTNDGHSHNPAWSPDGRQILFVHDAGLQSMYREVPKARSHHPVELYVMDRDGGNRHLLRHLEPVISSAAWPPDGKTIALSAMSSSGFPGLFLLPADGQGEPRLLIRNAWTSPDGKKIAFSLNEGRGEWSVHVANADGTGDVELTDPALGGGSPAWSPDGKHIAFDQFGLHVFVMDADGSHRRQIATDGLWSCAHPSWSADGKRLAAWRRTNSSPCGGISSVGTRLPECTRRLFLLSPFDANAKPVQLGDIDGFGPSFATVR